MTTERINGQLLQDDYPLDLGAVPAERTSRKRTSRKATAPAGKSSAVRAREQAARKAERYAHCYTGAAIALSAGLNGYEAAMGSGASGVGMAVAGTIGAAIPVLVWVLAKVTAWTYRAGWKRMAMVTGAVAACLLALSVVHVAAALAAWTGSCLLLSGLFAVGIDCGLVASEATGILVSVAE